VIKITRRKSSPFQQKEPDQPQPNNLSFQFEKVVGNSLRIDTVVANKSVEVKKQDNSMRRANSKEN